MKGQINIKHLNTLREVTLCNTLGYIVVVNGLRITNVAELFLKYKELRNELASCQEEIAERFLIQTINELSAFFYRCHISEEGDEEHRNEIRELKISNDYWTEI